MIQTDGLQDYVYSRFDHSDSLAENLLRLMESLLYLLRGWRVVAGRYTRAYFPSHRFLVVWRSEPPSILGYDVQIRPFLAWRLEPPCLLSHSVQSRFSQPDIPSYQFSWAFRAVVSIWHS